MNGLDKEMLLAHLRAREALLVEASRDSDPTNTDRLRAGATTYRLVLSEIESGMFDASQPTLKQVASSATAKVRHRDPHTSYSAAVSQTPERSLKLYQAIRIVLTGVGPMTDEELHAYLQNKNFKHTTSGLRTRRSELADAGWVRDSGNKRPTAAGSPAIVWEFVPSR